MNSLLHSPILAKSNSFVEVHGGAVENSTTAPPMIHFSDLPFTIAASTVGLIGSALTAVGTWVASTVNPDAGINQGVLIGAISAMAVFIAYLFRWYMTDQRQFQEKLMQRQEAMSSDTSKAIRENAAATMALNATNAKQNTYFETIAREALDKRLNSPQVFVEPPTKHSRPR